MCRYALIDVAYNQRKIDAVIHDARAHLCSNDHARPQAHCFTEAAAYQKERWEGRMPKPQLEPDMPTFWAGTILKCVGAAARELSHSECAAVSRWLGLVTDPSSINNGA